MATNPSKTTHSLLDDYMQNLLLDDGNRNGENSGEQNGGRAEETNNPLSQTLDATPDGTPEKRADDDKDGEALGGGWGPVQVHVATSGQRAASAESETAILNDLMSDTRTKQLMENFVATMGFNGPLTEEALIQCTAAVRAMRGKIEAGKEEGGICQTSAATDAQGGGFTPYRSRLATQATGLPQMTNSPPVSGLLQPTGRSGYNTAQTTTLAPRTPFTPVPEEVRTGD